MNDLKNVSEDELIQALQQRGWLYKAVRIPLQIPGPSEPYMVGHQLVKTVRP